MRRVTAFAAVLILLVTVSAAAAQDPFEVFVYVDRDTLTLHVPSSGVISLDGIGFQVQVNDAARTVELADYPAFGLPFDQLPTPICFRLRSSGSRTPLPQACSGAITLTQDLAAADVFWYDAVAESSRVILVTQNGVPFTICPSGASECTGTLTPPEATSTPAPTVTATVTPEQAFNVFLSDDDQLALEYPVGWIQDEYHSIDSFYASVLLYSSELARERGGMLQNGEYYIGVSINSTECLWCDTFTLLPLEAFVSMQIEALYDSRVDVGEQRTLVIADREVIQLEFTDNFGDGVFHFVSLENPRYYATIVGRGALGDEQALIPILEHIAASLQWSPIN